MNPDKNPYVPKHLKLNPLKEKNPYKEENPYLKKQEENPYLKKDKEGNSYKTDLNEKIDIKIDDNPIVTNPKYPTVTEVDRFRLRNIPIHKENPYANWKFSVVKDINPNNEAKCIKTTTNVDGRIDAFTVSPKSVNNEYLIEFDWKLNEEFIDAVKIEQGGSIESNYGVNEDKQTNFDIKNKDKHDKIKKYEQTRVHKRRNSIQKNNPWLTLFETTQFGNAVQPEESYKNDEKSGWTFCAVMDDPENKKSLNSYDESEDLKEAIEIAAKATVLEPDREITSDRNINTNVSDVNDSRTSCDSHRTTTLEVKMKEETNIVERNLPNFNKKIEALQAKLRLLFDYQKFEKESNQSKETIVANDSKTIQISESKENLEKEKIDPEESEIKELKQSKETIVANDSKNIQISELKESMNQTMEKEKIDPEESEIDDQTNPIADKKATVEKNWNAIKAEQQDLQIKISQNKAKEKYYPQLNVKFNGTIEYDHNVTTQTSKLPDNAPTFILVGDRFVREDKVLIDLDMNDFAPNKSSRSIIKSSQEVKLPLELQDIDFEGWYMQQIIEEFKNNLKNRNNKPKIKPIKSFLEEFDLL
ncbi:hypothetical protein C1645_881762 [Glomus cerebriforme]|uniref:Uncharacterized protein n=1 Tax=Glomus cerebriforme TaxID=658196 RepID=A0A397S8L9_9GLOM|nr:hypothetical protein C1645_881762 [Glomus cerebriforme]